MYAHVGVNLQVGTILCIMLCIFQFSIYYIYVCIYIEREREIYIMFFFVVVVVFERNFI